MARRPRIRFRSPGVKPGQKIGPLGPFRGRLGVQWVVAPLVLLVILGVVAWLFLRTSTPGEPWEAVATAESLAIGEAEEVLPGVFLGRVPDGRAFAVREEPGCPLDVAGEAYADCDGTLYGLDGVPVAEGDPLDLVPLQVAGGEIYLDPTRTVTR